ncbi:MAG: SPOR domain-containing protein [Pseudomonadota bacterium]
MRYLIKLIALLLLVNTILFLWPTKNNAPAHVHPRKVDVSAHLLKLNKEVEEAYYQEQSANNQVAALTESDSASADGACFRLGPFSQTANFEIAQAALFNADIDFTTSTREVNQSQVYRVYLGPFGDRAEAIDKRTELNNKGILDHFIRNESNGEVVVSLGIYTSQQSAESAISQFDGKIDLVKLRQERVTLPQTYWLYFGLSPQSKARSQLEAMDWGEVGARMGPFACQAESDSV